MTGQAKNVVILGSTGSIGRSTLEVIAASEGSLRAVALTAHRNLAQLLAQAQAVQPRWIVATDRGGRRRAGLVRPAQGDGTAPGPEGVARVAAEPEVDMVVSAIVGSAGLQGTWAALEAGKTLALANKESLVVAGPLVTRLAAENHARILPVDSEHSAIFQALQAGRREEVAPRGAHGQRRALPHLHAGATGPSVRRRRPGPSHLGDGAERSPSIRPP